MKYKSLNDVPVGTTISDEEFKQLGGNPSLNEMPIGTILSDEEFNMLNGIEPPKTTFTDKVGNFISETGVGKTAKSLAQATYLRTGGAKNIEKIDQENLATGDSLFNLAKNTTDPARKEKLLALSTEAYQSAGKTQEDIIGKLRSNEQILGDAAKTLITTLAFGTYGGASKIPSAISGVTSVGQGILHGIKAGAISGAISGGVLGTATGLASGLQENQPLDEVVKGGASGGLTGGLAGGAIGGVVGGISGGISQYLKNKANKTFIDRMITPDTQRGKRGLEAIKSGKVVEGTGPGGRRDFSKALPGFQDIKESVAQVPGISNHNTYLENVNLIHDEIGNVAEDLKSQIAKKGVFTPAQFNKYLTEVKNSLSENPTLVGDAEKTAEKIIDKFKNLVSDNGYTPSGLLEARKQLDRWIIGQKGTKILDPAIENAYSIALRAVRQGGNNFLSKLVPDVAVKDMLSHQSNLYRAIELIAPKAQKEGGNIFSRLVSLIRRHPIASIAASTLLGNKVTGLVNKVNNP